MRPIAIGKYRKIEQVVVPAQAPHAGSPQQTFEASREAAWAAEHLRRCLAVRRWRGLAALPVKQGAVHRPALVSSNP